MTRWILLAAALCFATSGCKLFKKDNAAADAAADTDAGTETATADTDAATDDAGTDAATVVHTADNIPGPQEPDSVAADITRTNYKSELDRLSNEVDNEK